MSGGIWNMPIASTTIAILDFETTGLHAAIDRVVEVSVIRLEPGAPAKLALDTLINPTRRMGATHIHGITDEKVVQAPRFIDIAGNLIESLSGCVLAAYNANFDISFLISEFQRVGITQVPPHICLMNLRPLLGLGKRSSLENTCKEYGIEQPNAHSAMGDALAAARLWKRYLYAITSRGLSKFSDLATLSTSRFTDSFTFQMFEKTMAKSLQRGQPKSRELWKARPNAKTPKPNLHQDPSSDSQLAVSEIYKAGAWNDLHVRCQFCNELLIVTTIRKKLRITCSQCRIVWDWPVNRPQNLPNEIARHTLNNAVFCAPTDFDEAKSEWKANCGPYALATAVGLNMADVKDVVINCGFLPKRLLKLQEMKQAIEQLGFRSRVTGRNTIPKRGICLVMATGPWEENKNTGIPFHSYTHWIAMAHKGNELLCCDTITRQWVSQDEWWHKLSSDWLLHLPNSSGGWKPYRSIWIENK